MRGSVTLRERYEDDLYLVRGAAGWGSLLALGALLLALPRVAPSYVVYVATLAAINTIIAVGLNLVVGYTGQISLGHAGFAAIGAYTAALLSARAGVPWALTLVAAGLVAAAFGFLVGVPALRLEGPYLTIATLGFGIAVSQVLTNWTALSGGRTGVLVPKLSLGGLPVSHDTILYHLAVGLAALLVWVAANLVRSHVGRAFMAVRDSDIAAQATGVNLTVYKTLAFGLSALYAGIGGGLTAYALTYIEPTVYTLLDSIYFFTMIVVGGLGSIPGSVIGAVVLTVLPQQLTRLRELLPIVYGVAIIAIMALEPAGLYGRWLRIRRYFKMWPL